MSTALEKMTVDDERQASIEILADSYADIIIFAAMPDNNRAADSFELETPGRAQNSQIMG
jgi:hypothetical protein